MYATPQAAVSARLLVRVLDDLLLPLAYPAELAGSSYSLSTGQGGLLLKVSGFTGVAQQLLLEVVTALKGEEEGGCMVTALTVGSREGVWVCGQGAERGLTCGKSV